MTQSDKQTYANYPKKEYYHKYYYDMEEVFENCARCSNCKWIDSWEVKHPRFAKVCPSVSYYYFDAYSAQGRMDLGKALLNGAINYDNAEKILDVMYKCNTCGGCDASCKRVQDMESLRAMLDLRAKLVEDGQVLPEHLPLLESLKQEDNTVMGKKAERGDWAQGLSVKDLTQEKADVVFHAGCKTSFDKKLWDVARGSIEILQRSGLDVGIMGKGENCCGCKVYDMGFRGEATKYAENNIEAWKNAGVKKVVTACSDGYYIMKRHYPDHGLDIEVVHLVELIHQLIKEGKLRFSKKVPMHVTYHDPCHLGRRLGQAPGYYVPGKATRGLYDEPREIIKSIPGLTFKEMFRIKEYGWCCGAAGGVKEAFPDFSMFTGDERVKEAREISAEAIITACPWCESQFNEAIVENGHKMKIYDIVELVRMAL